MKKNESLADLIGHYTHDPLGYVMVAFPWGEENSPLAHERGPRPWQVDILQEIGKALREGNMTTQQAILASVASGHG